VNMFWKRKKPKEIVNSVDPDRTFSVGTTDTNYMFYLVDGAFYIRKNVSKDPRYGLVVKINGREKYSERDLELGAEIEYIHPRLERAESAGRIKSIEVK